MTTLQKITSLNWHDFLKKLKEILIDLDSDEGTQFNEDQVNALEGANSPSETNPYATLEDVTNINTAFTVVPYTSTISTAFDSDIPNIEVHLTGNLDLTVTGTINGDSGLINLYFLAAQVATLQGFTDLVITGAANMIPVYYIHDSDGLKFYNVDKTDKSFKVTNTDKYILNETALTSAGVYDANNKLLRTLWSGVKKQAGSYDISTITWDGLSDDGIDVTTQAAYYKVVANNISETWEGVIGNLSSKLNGTNVWKGQAYPCDGLIVGDKIYLAFGANEQSGTVTSTSLSDYQRKVEVMYSPRIYPSYTHLAYDGTTVYFAGKWEWEQDGSTSGVSCSTIANLFNYQTWDNPASQTLSIYGNAFPIMDKVINVSKPNISGLAVQTGDNALVVARGEINTIRVVNKTTGALILEHTGWVNPKLCKIDSNNYLWFVHGTAGSEVAERFTLNAGTGTITSTGVSITGLNNVRALTFNPTGNFIAIADNNTNDIVKFYLTDNGTYIYSIGANSSYNIDATVYNDKFMFENYKDKEDRLSFLMWESNGSFWVNDEGNERIVKFNTNRNYIDAIQYKSAFYDLTIDYTDPTRVFSEFMEYKIDYNVSLEVGNDNFSWELTKNWGAINILNSQNIQSDLLTKTYGIETLSNGKTYALVSDKITGNATVFRFIELINGGVFRDTGVTITDTFQRTSFKRGGTITRGALIAGVGGNDWVFYKRLITGFDGSNNPILGTEQEVGRILAVNKPFADFPFDFGEKTADGTMILFRREKDGVGNYHLAGYKEGSNDRTFKTLKGVAYVDNSAYPLGTNTYDVRSSVGNLGSAPLAMDNWFIWGYYGEFWRNTQTNYWHMLTEDGLFLYDFGTDGTKNITEWGDAPRKMAGNAFSSQLVKVNGQVYLYHNDESWHGGIHRWRINNLDSIKYFKLNLN